MAKFLFIGGKRIGNVGNERYYRGRDSNLVQSHSKYVPVNSQWIKKEEFKEFIMALFKETVPQIYLLDALPEDLYDYALIFVRGENVEDVYLDKNGTRTRIHLGGVGNYDAVDIVQELPENPRNNVIYMKQENELVETGVRETPIYTMYVCENDTLTRIDLGNIEISGTAPIKVDENNNISLEYDTTQFEVTNSKLTADPLKALIDNKQDKLVSGVNIRTVGGNSLVAENLMRQDIEPSDIMSLAEPLKWDTQDSYKVKLGYNSSDFELDSNDDLKLKAIDYPVKGAVSPLYLDSNKKVNIGIINGKGLKVASNNLQMGVNAPLYEASGNQLALNYNTSHFSIISNKLDGKPLKDLIDKNTTALTSTSRLVGIFSNTSTQATTSNAWKSLKLATSNDVNTDYCELLGDRILFNKNAIYKFTVTCRLVDTIGVMTPLCWTLGVSGTDDTIGGGDWVASVQRHKSTQVFVVYVTKSTGLWPRVYIENSALNCQYVRITLEAMKG